MGPSRTAGTLLLGVLVPACSLLVSTSDLATNPPSAAPSPEGGAASTGAGATTPPEAGAEAGNPTGDPSLVGAWSFDETTGNTAADSSGHGHTANLIGP